VSDEEQQAAEGRTMEEYVECSRMLAALLAEATRVGNDLTQIGQSLRTIADAHSNGITGEASKIPTPDSVRQLASEIFTEMDRKRQLRLSLRNMGLDLKD
jgi:hypothetical protein